MKYRCSGLHVHVTKRLSCPGCSSRCSRRRIECKGTGTSSGDDAFDVDLLAQQLSSAASKMKGTEEQAANAQGSSSSSTDSDVQAVPEPQQQGAVSMAEISAAAGTGPNFFANDFVINQKIASLNVRSVTAGDVGDMDGSKSQQVDVASTVNLFAASYESGMPFQSAVTVVLKEYGPSSRRLGLNELTLLTRLQDLPADEDRWRRAQADMTQSAAVPVLGWFESEASEAAAQRAKVNSLWLVMKYEGMQPAQGFARSRAAASTARGPLAFMGHSRDSQIARRKDFLRSFFSGCLSALAALHSRQIAHGSIGSGCFMVNTQEATEATKLVVKLDNLGFGQAFTGGDGSGSGLQRALVTDKEALAVTFCEMTFGSLVTEEGSGVTADAITFNRLLCEVFGRDALQLRDYCTGVDEWRDGIDFLDEIDGGGWHLLDLLLQGDSDCLHVAECPFLSAPR